MEVEHSRNGGCVFALGIGVLTLGVFLWRNSSPSENSLSLPEEDTSNQELTINLAEEDLMVLEQARFPEGAPKENQEKTNVLSSR